MKIKKAVEVYCKNIKTLLKEIDIFRKIFYPALLIIILLIVFFLQGNLTKEFYLQNDKEATCSGTNCGNYDSIQFYFWLLSSTIQGFAALGAIIYALAIFKLNQLEQKYKNKESILKRKRIRLRAQTAVIGALCLFVIFLGIIGLGLFPILPPIFKLLIILITTLLGLMTLVEIFLYNQFSEDKKETV